MAVNIQLRRGTAAEWTAANPTLAVGEIGIETDTDRFKIGNGTDDWDTRPYGGLQGVVTATSPITYDSGTQTVGIDESAISIDASQISDVTATATELNYVDGVTSDIQTQLDSKEPLQRTVEAELTSRTLDIADAQKTLIAVNAVTLTVPDGVFSAGHRIDFIQDGGADPITFAAGAGMTINSKGGALSTSEQYAAATIFFADASTAYLVGDLA